MFSKRHINISRALEISLLFLALSVFAWALQGKLSQYHPQDDHSHSIPAMAKISKEGGASLEALLPDQSRPATWSYAHVLFLSLNLPYRRAASALAASREPGPSISGTYNLQDADMNTLSPPLQSR